MSAVPSSRNTSHSSVENQSLPSPCPGRVWQPLSPSVHGTVRLNASTKLRGTRSGVLVVRRRVAATREDCWTPYRVM